MQSAQTTEQKTQGKRQRFPLWLAGLGLVVVVAVVVLGGWGWQRYSQQQVQMSLQQIDRWRMQALAGQEVQALPALRQAAKENNVAAQRALAEVLLRKADGVQEAVHFAELAAAQGDVAAQYMLGKSYFDGTITATRLPDMARARHWLESAAEKKSTSAMYMLGLMHQAGYGGAVDFARATQWFAKAVQLGHAEAMFMLGNAYANGQGVTQDNQQALRLYKAAAEKENPQAAQVLAMAYHEGGLGLKQDKKEADQMLLEVAHILSHPDHQ